MEKRGPDPTDDVSDPGGSFLEFEDGRREWLRSSCAIGRSSQNQVVLDDALVSRFHALVQTQGDGEHVLVDLGSSNGTQLNGRRVVLPTRLTDGDCVRVGRLKLIFHQGPAPEADAAASARRTRSTERVPDMERGSRWLLVADIVDYTRLSQQMEATDLAQRVGVWIHDCKLVLESHQGTLNKYLGDGFLAYWPQDSMDPQRIVGVVDGLQRMQKQHDLCFRVVLHRGDTLIDRQIASGEENLLGNEVNFVFRMEKVASGAGLQWLLSAPAALGLRDHLETVPVARHAIRGFSGEHQFFEPAWASHERMNGSRP